MSRTTEEKKKGLLMHGLSKCFSAKDSFNSKSISSILCLDVTQILSFQGRVLPESPSYVLLDQIRMNQIAQVRIPMDKRVHVTVRYKSDPYFHL